MERAQFLETQLAAAVQAKAGWKLVALAAVVAYGYVSITGAPIAGLAAGLIVYVVGAIVLEGRRYR
jgi:hypothetical protein